MTSTALVVREYEGIQVFFQDDAYINATAIARHFGKEPRGWLKTDSTKEYIEACRKKFRLEENQLVITQFGAPENGGGTWIHPKLAIHFARWLNAEFAVWCDEQIEAILKGEKLPTIEPGLGSQALRIIADQFDAVRTEFKQEVRRLDLEITQIRARALPKPRRLALVNVNQVGLDLNPSANKPKRPSKGGTHASPRPHDRSGYWRLQGNKRIWVRPTRVNAKVH